MTNHSDHADCHHEHAPHDHGRQHAHSDGAPANPLVTSAQATLHCLTGCIIGEVAGLAIGVTIGLGVWPTMTLATMLSYVSGFSLGVLPVMRRQKKTFVEALKLIWIGEAISIGVMEIAMNAADYAVGGMNSTSVFTTAFWIGIAAAVPAGFLAAWPVNWILLKRDLKHCH